MIANVNRINQLRGSKYLSSNALAEKLGISITKFYIKLHNADFTKKEIKILSEILQVAEKELILW